MKICGNHISGHVKVSCKVTLNQLKPIRLRQGFGDEVSLDKYVCGYLLLHMVQSTTYKVGIIIDSNQG